MVDEAHRLKNDESALYKELATWHFGAKLLVTGTPLQNNIRELWALLHFLHPERFPDAAAFEAAHDAEDAAGVARLHAALRPHLLRRVIKDVERSLPPKSERVLRVPMTPLQRQYYKWVLGRNFKELNKKGRAQVTLLNVLMDLKKVRVGGWCWGGGWWWLGGARGVGEAAQAFGARCCFILCF